MKDNGTYKNKFHPGTEVNQGPLSTSSSKDLYSNKEDVLIWNKEQINFVWNKLKNVKERVKIKKKRDYQTIINEINLNKEDLVISKLSDPSFKRFYRNKDSLYPDDVFVDYLIKNNKFELLRRLLKDPSYCYHEDFIFEYIFEFLTSSGKDPTNDNMKKDRAKSVYLNKEEIENIQKFNKNIKIKRRMNHTSFLSLNSIEVDDNNKLNQLKGPKFIKFKNIIKKLILNKYYPKTELKIKIIAWILAYFANYDSFRFLIHENPIYFYQEIEKFNQFLDDKSIRNYANDIDVFEKTLSMCFQVKLEKLSIVLCEYFPIQIYSENIPVLAAETNSMSFLKYYWEKSSKIEIEKEKKGINERRSKKLNYTMIGESNVSGSNNNSMNINNNLTVDKSNIINGNESIILKSPINNDKKEKEENGNSKRKNTFTPLFSIDLIIKTLRKQHLNKSKEINDDLSQILTWKHIEKDPTFIKSLLSNNCFEQISELINIWPKENFLKPEYFQEVIYKKQCELIIFYLHERDLRQILNDSKIQKFIVEEYIPYGDKLYYASEMLSYIFKTFWDSSLTKNLCKNIIKTIKTRDILNCHSPILTCLLLCEFLNQIKELSISNIGRCKKVIEELMEFCKKIQESNTDESYISYLMKQKDTKKRSAFQIASDTYQYCLLETPEVGTIVKKMWYGYLSNNGLFTASSLHRYVTDNDRKLNDPFISFDILDRNKVYFFQLSVWLDSCSLRFFPSLIMTIFLIVVYNLFIYLLNFYGQLMNNYNELKKDLQLLLFLYLFGVSHLLLDIIFKYIFIKKTKRNSQIEVWSYFDILLFIFAWLILLDTKKVSGEYNSQELEESIQDLIWSLHLPFIKEFKNEYGKFMINFPFLLRVFILSLNDFFVWVRVCGVLLTFKEMGPVIRMIISMTVLLIKYILVIFAFLACSASIFAILFNKYSYLFIDLSTSVITLFGGFLNKFELLEFESSRRYFGSILFIFYVCIAGVLLVNLLIAVISSVYEQMSTVVDSSHRAVLIQYYSTYKWDDRYGYIIFLSAPLNIFNFFTVLIETFCIRIDKKYEFNDKATKLYYLVFIFPILFVVFLIYTVCLIPLCYIKGIIYTIKYQVSLKILWIKKTRNIIGWIMTGIFFLCYIYIRDIFYLLFNIYRKAQSKISEFERIKKNLPKEDVITFLKFIHSNIKEENKQNLHKLFLAYLDFEASEEAQKNAVLKKQKEYLDILNKPLSQTVISKNINNNILLYNKSFEKKNISKNYVRIIRKNLMIIEILSSFLINDENGTGLIDIEKMKKLFPFTMNIKNYHLERFIHCNIHVLNQVMEKVKIRKSTFIQYQLLNRIMSSVQRLDKEIDSELFKIQRMREISLNFEKKNENKFESENEDIRKNKDKQSDINNGTVQSVESSLGNNTLVSQKRKDLILMKDYNKVLKEIRQSIVTILVNKNSSVSVNSTNLIDGNDISSLYSENNIKNSLLKNTFNLKDKDKIFG